MVMGSYLELVSSVFSGCGGIEEIFGENLAEAKGDRSMSWSAVMFG